MKRRTRGRKGRAVDYATRGRGRGARGAHLSMSWSSVAGRGCTRQCMARGRGGSVAPGAPPRSSNRGAQSRQRDGETAGRSAHRSVDDHHASDRDERCATFERRASRATRHRTATASEKEPNVDQHLAAESSILPKNLKKINENNTTNLTKQNKRNFNSIKCKIFFIKKKNQI